MRERKTSKAGPASSKKVLDPQATPHSQELTKHKGVRKKALMQREIAKESPHPRKMPTGNSPTAQQPESHSKPTPRNESDPLDFKSSPSHTEPVPADPQNQEKNRKAHKPRKKAQTNPTPKDVAQSIRTSPNGAMSEGLAQENEIALSEVQPTREGQPPQVPAKSAQEGSAPVVHPGGREQAQKRGKSQKREVVGKPLDEENAAPSQLRAKETQQAHKDSRESKQSYAQRHNILVTKQQSKENRTRKNGGVPQDRSLAAPQNQVSEGDQGNRTGRLRARGSQSIKV